MKRFPDIIVISWQCECGEYMTESIDISNVTVDRVYVLHRCHWRDRCGGRGDGKNKKRALSGFPCQLALIAMRR